MQILGNVKLRRCQVLNRSVLHCIASTFLVVGLAVRPARGDLPDSGDIHLEINLDTAGTMTLQPNNANLAGYSIRSPDGKLVPGADGPYIFPLFDTPFEVRSGIPLGGMLTEDLVLGHSFAGDRAQAENVIFQYTPAGTVSPVAGIVHVVPEPATMILIAAGGLLVLPSRRRST